MILEYGEDMNYDFNGTVIDIETIGEFDDSHRNDSRRYKDIKMVILGYITNRRLQIYCAKGEEAITELKVITVKILDGLTRPFYAFNCDFESGVFFHHLDKEVVFDGELQGSTREQKANAVRSLRIPNYSDPFNDVGRLCMTAWSEGKFDSAIAHNRACLLKEGDVLLKRGFREPSELRFIR